MTKLLGNKPYYGNKPYFIEFCLTSLRKHKPSKQVINWIIYCFRICSFTYSTTSPYLYHVDYIIRTNIKFFSYFTTSEWKRKYDINIREVKYVPEKATIVQGRTKIRHNWGSSLEHWMKKVRGCKHFYESASLYSPDKSLDIFMGKIEVSHLQCLCWWCDFRCVQRCISEYSKGIFEFSEVWAAPYGLERVSPMLFLNILAYFKRVSIVWFVYLGGETHSRVAQSFIFLQTPLLITPNNVHMSFSLLGTWATVLLFVSLINSSYVVSCDTTNFSFFEINSWYNDSPNNLLDDDSYKFVLNDDSLKGLSYTLIPFSNDTSGVGISIWDYFDEDDEDS